MTNTKVLTAFKKFRRLSGQMRQKFFSAFEKKMIYRTTKTENPQTTSKMVDKVLNKFLTPA